MSSFVDSLKFHADTLALRSRRGSVLATNIANAATPHFKAWSDFKESGGVLSQTSTKASAPADWAIQEKGE